MRNFVLSLFVAGALATSASAQTITFVSTPGTAQAIPAAPGSAGSAGTVRLSAAWWQPQQNLVFSVSCVDPSWIPYQDELVIFGFNVGTAILPGVPYLGGTLYLPLTPAPILVSRGGVVWLGPGDVVPPTASIAPPGTCANPSPGFGRSIQAPFALTGGTTIPITVQALVFDFANNVTYTSNAIDFVMS